MAKFLKTAAVVVGAVALIATGIGAAGGASLLGATAAGTAATATSAAVAGTVLGISTATFATIGVIAGVAAGVLSLGAAALASTPKGSVGGNQTKFTIDKESGNPVAIGRTASGGKVVHRQTHGAKNAFETWVTAHSIGPVRSIGPLLIDSVSQTFSAGGGAIGTFAGYMWLATQLGACPEAAALPTFNGPVSGWDSSSKLSGLAADLWCLKFDTEGKKYPSGVPERLRVIEGVFAYDPRLDSSFPGGNGPCRIADPSTYIWTENPALNALIWAFGHHQNGVLIAGGGLNVTGIDVAPFAEWASVCEANNWKVGGIVYTASDDSWDVLKMIAQAGGGEVMPVGALLSCTFSAPRVSIGTITSADIIGDIDAPSSASQRLRRNTVIPKVRLESQGWQVVPLSALSIPEYVAADGGKRPKELDLPLVQDADQGAELGLYDILNARELDGIVLPCKVYAIGYRPGDCLTLDIPEANLNGLDVMIRNREMDGSTMAVTLTARTETAGKHAFALGKTGTPPPTPDLTIPPAYGGAPDAGDWSLTGVTLSAKGASIPALLLTGGSTTPSADSIQFEYRTHGTSDWVAGGVENAGVTRKEITGVTPGTSYDVAVSYRVRGVFGNRLILPPVTAGELAVPRASYRLVSQTVVYPITSDDTHIMIAAFDGTLDDTRSVSFPAATVGSLANGTTYGIFWNLVAGAYEVDAAPAAAALASADYVFLGWTTTSSGGTYPAGPAAPGGYRGNGAREANSAI